jgi:hypothetical protein
LKPDKINFDDFTKVAPLCKGYEMDPQKIYLVVCDGKKVKLAALHSLLTDLNQMHPNFQIAVVATVEPGAIDVMEKADGKKEEGSPAESVSGTTEQNPR